MSKFTKFDMEFKDIDTIVEALKELGLTEDQIEVGDLEMKGYSKNQKAQVVVRKANIGARYGDLGFQRQQDGTFRLIHDDLEGEKIARHLNLKGKINTQISNMYAQMKVKQFARRNGYRIASREENKEGLVKLRLVSRGA